MSAELNAEFTRKRGGLEDFLVTYPMDIDVGQFSTTGPLTLGAGRVNYRDVMDRSRTDHATGAGNQRLGFKLIENWGVPVWCDFNIVAEGPSKGLVQPKLYQTRVSDDHVRLFYLPWGEDQRHMMDINDAADYFVTASMHGCRFEVHRKEDMTLHVSHSNVQPSGAFDAQARLKDLRRADIGRGDRLIKLGKAKYYADSIRLMGVAQHRLIMDGIAPEDVLSADPDAYKANVLGQRSITGSWSFYYQLWGLLQVGLHERVERKKWLGLKSEYVENTRTMTLKQVLLVKQIYPNETTIFELA